ncbi:DUF2238 domain-containing protein [Dysgonomonas sp. 520]|uniref:DUF2238 domain-containing protein n=1 Tax=Dysgonomonas sp. 520 TaxID=2302931 RepID=UPI0013D1D7AE|nr:DUF2238 domain-containing protein [Dysgonomonas sp. 520]NDW10036.1 DUF2238 domain-containing protein [Dysgonomonas sp. 520]
MKRLHVIFLVILFLVCLWSAISPYGYVLWFLESLPVIIGFAILAFTYKKFRFTDMTYFFILLHFIILLIGAHYTYAKVPLFDWVRDEFGLMRNNYDKVGHFAQGFVPAFITREILIRLKVLNKKSWLPVIVVSICLSISALYELFEWFVAVVIKQSADNFLGMQGYEWDTQSDMLCATIGAIVMLVLFSKWQNKQIRKIEIEGV